MLSPRVLVSVSDTSATFNKSLIMVGYPQKTLKRQLKCKRKIIKKQRKIIKYL
ncbi:hypothetical protein CWATWH0402_5908 [Crocosphaera watsonii WH 0402]|uniref:Uncharacterized protein n=1 Tax=Crocosphaera watsonii WH 0402 TaxID=1284629 RepID=T2JXY8_CROWT|nr:hypothetical protein CWATWH0402_5908 [Crocosphaera watsonii WH 0402]